MGFIVDGTPVTIWAPVINTDTLYSGQLVTVSDEGVKPLPLATGPYDASGHNIPFGVVVGTNRKTPLFDATQLAEYVTYASPVNAGNEDYTGVEGVWAKGDLQAMVEIALINPTTVLKGPLYNGANPGTAPTASVLSGTPDTVSATSGTTNTGLASLSTIYFRNGTAAGHYRVTDDTSTTAITWDLPVVAAATAGDTVVRVPLRPQGKSRMQLGTEALHINTGATLSSAYFGIEVIELNLENAGSEYCRFRFSADHFQSEARFLEGSVTWDAGSLSDAAGETSSGITVTGAEIGDFVLVSASVEFQDMIVTGYVQAANTVEIRIQNESGGTIDLASATFYVRVLKR